MVESKEKRRKRGRILLVRGGVVRGRGNGKEWDFVTKGWGEGEVITETCGWVENVVSWVYNGGEVPVGTDTKVQPFLIWRGKNHGGNMGHG